MLPAASSYPAVCQQHRASDSEAQGLLLLHIVALLHMQWPETHHDMTCKHDIIRPAETFSGVTMVVLVFESLLALQSIPTRP